MRVSRRWKLLLLGLLALPAIAGAQQGTTITGRVTVEGGTPLASANVFIEGLGLGTTTDEGGRYSFTVPGARAQGQSVRLTARRVGYTVRSTTVTLNPG
jgi:hypothetical protein